jgi:hypothetical protein
MNAVSAYYTPRRVAIFSFYILRQSHMYSATLPNKLSTAFGELPWLYIATGCGWCVVAM